MTSEMSVSAVVYRRGQRRFEEQRHSDRSDILGNPAYIPENRPRYGDDYSPFAACLPG
jgi:hypothetical protein